MGTAAVVTSGHDCSRCYLVSADEIGGSLSAVGRLSFSEFRSSAHGGGGGSSLAASISLLLRRWDCGHDVGTDSGRSIPAEADRAEATKKANRQAHKRLQQIEGERGSSVRLRRSRPSRGGKRRHAAFFFFFFFCLREIFGDMLDRRPPIWKDTPYRPLVVANLSSSTWPNVPGLSPRRQGKRAVFTKPLASPRPVMDQIDTDTLAVMSIRRSTFYDVGQIIDVDFPLLAGAGRPGTDARARSSGHLRNPKHLAVSVLESRAIERGLHPLGAGARPLLKITARRSRPSTFSKHVPRGLRYCRQRGGKRAGHRPSQHVRDVARSVCEDHYLAILSLNNLPAAIRARRMRQALALFEEARDGILLRLGRPPDSPISSIILAPCTGHLVERRAVSLSEQVTRLRNDSWCYHPDTIYTL